MNPAIATKASEVERLLAELRELVTAELPGGVDCSDVQRDSSGWWIIHAGGESVASKSPLPAVVAKMRSMLLDRMSDAERQTLMLATGFDRIAMGC